MSESTQKHGFFGKTIKILMVIIFFAIGAATLVLGALSLAKGWYKETGDGQWVPIVNIVFGACLLTSPFFLSHKREGLNKIIKFIIAFAFVAIGILFIVGGSLGVTQNWYPDYQWYPIVNIVFGALLFTSPFFLKKS